MNFDYIRRKTASIVKKYGERDPHILCDRMGIKLYYADFSRLKGMYRVILRNRCIFLSSALSSPEEKIVLAHELGHDALHREMASSSFFSDEMLFDLSMKPEYEANLFAADLLLPDSEVLEAAKTAGDQMTAAGILETDPNLFSLKIRLLRAEGQNLPELPYDRDFLKNKSGVAKSENIW